ncbi:hypothetical protein RRG08_023491 [Elysia crispata]|uniref:RING-type domain-containing protein n=1 Tax=Elysia crispata TaxID=231223 RepID=A0AAE1D7M6_9GAST|nr:hypothetical protein RRG08_023491 [Elysia crispata]
MLVSLLSRDHIKLWTLTERLAPVNLLCPELAGVLHTTGRGRSICSWSHAIQSRKPFRMHYPSCYYFIGLLSFNATPGRVLPEIEDRRLEDRARRFPFSPLNECQAVLWVTTNTGQLSIVELLPVSLTKHRAVANNSYREKINDPRQSRAFSLINEQRKRANHDGQTPCCPVCGLTLRAGELEAHLMLEIDKLDRLSRGGRKSRDSTPQGRKSLPSPGGSRKGKDSPPPEVASRSRYDTFLRVRCNRQSRLTARRGQKKRRPGEEGVKETICPICNERLTGATEELNAHVELCLKQRTGVDEEEPVDVEGEFEEYEWAGQTRVRATSMLEGGFSGSGFQISKKGSDEDAELNVDGDDTEEYGKPQFSERDMVPLGSNGDSPGTSGSSQTFPLESSFASRTDTVNSDGAGCSSSSTAYEVFDLSNCDEGVSGQSTSALLSALRLKLRDLQAEKVEKQKCLICMEAYKTPLTSIQCWHVHCENCWMRTLGAKKLCPQCNMITSPLDLRRIFL